MADSAPLDDLGPANANRPRAAANRNRIHAWRSRVNGDVSDKQNILLFALDFQKVMPKKIIILTKKQK